MNEPDLSEFRCLRCGNCCRKHGTVRLTDAESQAIADFLKIGIYDFTRKYTALLPDRSALTLSEFENGDCVFYDPVENKCRIHPVKPKQCRDFPFFWRFPGWETVCAGGADLQKRRQRAIVKKNHTEQKTTNEGIRTMYPKIYLAIDNCVASKRWCEPAHWMNLFADCGVYYVEASADNEIDPLYTQPAYLRDWAETVLADAGKTGVKVMNLYSGHGTYATLGLAHPDVRVRDRIHHDWLDKMIDLAAEMNAGLGFFCHAFDQHTLNTAECYAFAYNDLVHRLAELAAYADSKKLDSIGVEQMYTPHQVPWTVANAGQLLRDCYAVNGKEFGLTIDTGHQSGQRKFAVRDDAAMKTVFESIRTNGRAEGIYLGSDAAAKEIVSGALKGASDDSLLEIVRADRAAYPWLYSIYSDGDTYRWLEDLGTWSPIVHLQQTDGKSSAHQPFSEKCNANGIIRGDLVLKALKAAYDKPVTPGMPKPCEKITLTLEVFAGTADLTCDIVNKISDSVRYWRKFIPEDGLTLDQLVGKLG